MSATTEEAGSWDEQIWRQLETHIEAERDILARYDRAAELAEDADVRYLIRLILDDELRHHRLFEEMANALRGAIRWEDIEPKVPALGHRPLPPDLLEETERFIAAEREDARHLKELRRELRPVAETTLWSLLVDLMAFDTDKHLRILEFIARRGSS